MIFLICSADGIGTVWSVPNIFFWLAFWLCDLMCGSAAIQDFDRHKQTATETYNLKQKSLSRRRKEHVPIYIATSSITFGWLPKFTTNVMSGDRSALFFDWTMRQLDGLHSGNCQRKKTISTAAFFSFFPMNAMQPSSLLVNTAVLPHSNMQNKARNESRVSAALVFFSVLFSISSCCGSLLISRSPSNGDHVLSKARMIASSTNRGQLIAAPVQSSFHYFCYSPFCYF